LNKKRKLFWLVVKLFITSGLIYWLLSNLEGNTDKRVIALIKPIQIVTAIALHVCVFFLAGLRWWLLLKYAGTAVSFFKILPSYYLGIFFNNLLPTSMGGDVVRIAHLKLRGVNIKTLIGSTIADRVIGLITTLIMGTTGILFSLDINLAYEAKFYLIVFVLIVSAGFFLMLTPPMIALIEKLAHRYQHTRLRKTLLEIIALCYSYRFRKKIVLTAAALTVLIQSLVILIYFFLGKICGLGLPLITYYGVIPFVFIAASLPVSIGGLGIREGALVGLLVAIGVDSHLAITLSLLYLFVFIVSSLPGGLMILLGRNENARS